jgi:hypothetical protein
MIWSSCCGPWRSEVRNWRWPRRSCSAQEARTPGWSVRAVRRHATSWVQPHSALFRACRAAWHDAPIHLEPHPIAPGGSIFTIKTDSVFVIGPRGSVVPSPDHPLPTNSGTARGVGQREHEFFSRVLRGGHIEPQIFKQASRSAAPYNRRRGPDGGRPREEGVMPIDDPGSGHHYHPSRSIR